MSLTTLPQDGGARTPFAQMLRLWRRRRRMSQLELALESGVSQRHLSFLESGRAQPSRAMILQLGETLEVPLPGRGDRPCVEHLALEPSVRCAERDARRRPVDPPRRRRRARNLLRLFFHPHGIRSYVVNWTEAAPLLWHRARREAEALGGQETQAVLNDLGRFQDFDTLWAAESAALVPVLPLTIEKDGLRVSLFTVISTFGTAQDVTADELRIESLFPADDATERLFRAMANGQAASRQ